MPISIHGDAIPVVRVGKPGSESLECISIQSLLAFGATLEINFLLYAMFESNKVEIGAGYSCFIGYSVEGHCLVFEGSF